MADLDFLAETPEVASLAEERLAGEISRLKQAASSDNIFQFLDKEDEEKVRVWLMTDYEHQQWSRKQGHHRALSIGEAEQALRQHFQPEQHLTTAAMARQSLLSLEEAAGSQELASFWRRQRLSIQDPDANATKKVGSDIPDWARSPYVSARACVQVDINMAFAYLPFLTLNLAVSGNLQYDFGSKCWGWVFESMIGITGGVTLGTWHLGLGISLVGTWAIQEVPFVETKLQIQDYIRARRIPPVCHERILKTLSNSTTQCHTKNPFRVIMSGAKSLVGKLRGALFSEDRAKEAVDKGDDGSRQVYIQDQMQRWHEYRGLFEKPAKDPREVGTQVWAICCESWTEVPKLIKQPTCFVRIGEEASSVGLQEDQNKLAKGQNNADCKSLFLVDGTSNGDVLVQVGEQGSGFDGSGTVQLIQEVKVLAINYDKWYNISAKFRGGQVQFFQKSLEDFEEYDDVIRPLLHGIDRSVLIPDVPGAWSCWSAKCRAELGDQLEAWMRYMIRGARPEVLINFLEGKPAPEDIRFVGGVISLASFAGSSRREALVIGTKIDGSQVVTQVQVSAHRYVRRGRLSVRCITVKGAREAMVWQPYCAVGVKSQHLLGRGGTDRVLRTTAVDLEEEESVCQGERVSSCSAITKDQAGEGGEHCRRFFFCTGSGRSEECGQCVEGGTLCKKMRFMSWSCRRQSSALFDPFWDEGRSWTIFGPAKQPDGQAVEVSLANFGHGHRNGTNSDALRSNQDSLFGTTQLRWGQLLGTDGLNTPTQDAWRELEVPVNGERGKSATLVLAVHWEKDVADADLDLTEDVMDADVTLTASSRSEDDLEHVLEEAPGHSEVRWDRLVWAGSGLHTAAAQLLGKIPKYAEQVMDRFVDNVATDDRDEGDDHIDCWDDSPLCSGTEVKRCEDITDLSICDQFFQCQTEEGKTEAECNECAAPKFSLTKNVCQIGWFSSCKTTHCLGMNKDDACLATCFTGERGQRLSRLSDQAHQSSSMEAYTTEAKDDRMINFGKVTRVADGRHDRDFKQQSALSMANAFVRIVGNLQDLFLIYFADDPMWDGKCETLKPSHELFYELADGRDDYKGYNDGPGSPFAFSKRSLPLRRYARRGPQEAAFVVGAEVAKPGKIYHEDKVGEQLGKYNPAADASFAYGHGRDPKSEENTAKAMLNFFTADAPNRHVPGSSAHLHFEGSTGATVFGPLWCHLLRHEERSSGLFASDATGRLPEGELVLSFDQACVDAEECAEQMSCEKVIIQHHFVALFPSLASAISSYHEQIEEQLKHIESLMAQLPPPEDLDTKLDLAVHHVRKTIGNFLMDLGACQEDIQRSPILEHLRRRTKEAGLAARYDMCEQARKHFVSSLAEPLTKGMMKDFESMFGLRTRLPIRYQGTRIASRELRIAGRAWRHVGKLQKEVTPDIADNSDKIAEATKSNIEETMSRMELRMNPPGAPPLEFPLVINRFTLSMTFETGAVSFCIPKQALLWVTKSATGQAKSWTNEPAEMAACTSYNVHPRSIFFGVDTCKTVRRTEPSLTGFVKDWMVPSWSEKDRDMTFSVRFDFSAFDATGTWSQVFSSPSNIAGFIAPLTMGAPPVPGGIAGSTFGYLLGPAMWLVFALDSDGGSDTRADQLSEQFSKNPITGFPSLIAAVQEQALNDTNASAALKALFLSIPSSAWATGARKGGKALIGDKSSFAESAEAAAGNVAEHVMDIGHVDIDEDGSGWLMQHADVDFPGFLRDTSARVKDMHLTRHGADGDSIEALSFDSNASLLDLASSSGVVFRNKFAMYGKGVRHYREYEPGQSRKFWSWSVQLAAKYEFTLPLPIPAVGQVTSSLAFQVEWDLTPAINKKMDEFRLPKHQQRVAKCQECLDAGHAFCDRKHVDDKWNPTMDVCVAKSRRVGLACLDIQGFDDYGQPAVARYLFNPGDCGDMEMKPWNQGYRRKYGPTRIFQDFRGMEESGLWDSVGSAAMHGLTEPEWVQKFSGVANSMDKFVAETKAKAQELTEAVTGVVQQTSEQVEDIQDMKAEVKGIAQSLKDLVELLKAESVIPADFTVGHNIASESKDVTRHALKDVAKMWESQPSKRSAKGRHHQDSLSDLPKVDRATQDDLWKEVGQVAQVGKDDLLKEVTGLGGSRSLLKEVGSKESHGGVFGGARKGSKDRGGHFP